MRDELTRPERFAGLSAARAELEKVKACPCVYCLNRDTTVLVWGRAICTTRDRTFPKCTTDGHAPAFELDEQQLRGMV